MYFCEKNKIISFFNDLDDGIIKEKDEFYEILNCLKNIDIDLSIYRGMLSFHYFKYFNDFIDKDIKNKEIVKCIDDLDFILKDNSPKKIKDYFLRILKEKKIFNRKMLLGCFYAAT